MFHPVTLFVTVTLFHCMSQYFTVCLEEQCVTVRPCHTVSHTVSEEQYLTATLFNCVLVRPCKPGFSPCLPCLSCLLSKHSSRASQTYSISGVNQFRELRDWCCPSCCCEEKAIWEEIGEDGVQGAGLAPRDDGGKIRRRWKDLKEIWGESGELGIGGIGLGILELQLRLTDPLAPRSCWGWKSWERERLLEEVQEGEHYCKKTKVVKNLKRSSKEWSSPSSEGSHGFLVRSSSYKYANELLSSWNEKRKNGPLVLLRIRNKCGTS